MLIKEPSGRDPKAARELKVKIPLTYHIRLHSMKIMTGKPISDVVRDALEHYFKGVNAASGTDAGDDPADGEPPRGP